MVSKVLFSFPFALLPFKSSRGVTLDFTVRVPSQHCCEVFCLTLSLICFAFIVLLSSFHEPWQALKKLKQCEVVGKKLPMNYLFGCVGHSRFLINLKSKATGRLADSVVKNALGALCEATPFETKQRGEKFVPGRSLRKRGTASSENKRRKGEATIEREAARVFGKCDGVALLLATGGRIDEYQYDSTVGLVLGEKQIQDTGAEDVTAGLDREVGGGAVSSAHSSPRQELLHAQVAHSYLRVILYHRPHSGRNFIALKTYISTGELKILTFVCPAPAPLPVPLLLPSSNLP